MARRKDTFVVNLWLEPDETGQPRGADWRGSVEHLTTRRRLYFSDLVELVAFLAAHATAPRPEDGDRSA
jgi:hypothetical protein